MAVPPPSAVSSDLVTGVLQILRNWHLESAQQVALLALPGDTRQRALQRMAIHGSSAVDEEFQQRARLLMAISNALDTLYPFNRSAGCLWITTPNVFFNNATPVAVMLEEGMAGMQRIMQHLDGDPGWG